MIENGIHVHIDNNCVFSRSIPNSEMLALILSDHNDLFNEVASAISKRHSVFSILDNAFIVLFIISGNIKSSIPIHVTGYKTFDETIIQIRNLNSNAAYDYCIPLDVM